MDRSSAHRPVLSAEVVELLKPEAVGLIVDCTVGTGGHAEAMLSAAGTEARLIGIDRDTGALALARQRLKRFGGSVRLFQANFADVADVLAEADEASAGVVLADLGIASTQLDDAGRGFSFRADGPLDMRFSTDGGRTAADLVNALSESELADLIYAFGQERYSRRIGRAIAASAKHERIERTGQLARIVQAALPPAVRAKRRGVHPATRTFQALRIAVNDELVSLENLLERLPGVLSIGGRAGIISYHSLEDRRVKQAFVALAQAGRAELLTRKPVSAGEAELAENPRSRSAKLRGIRRIA